MVEFSIYLFLIEELLLYNIVLVSAIHQNMNHSWVYIRPLPLEPPSHLPPHSTLLVCYRALLWVPWGMQQMPTGVWFWYGSVCVSRLLRPLSPPRSHHVHGLFSMSASPVLSISYICVNMWFLSFSFWLTSSYIIGSSFIQEW